MNLAVLSLSLLVGIILAEIAQRAFGRLRLRIHLRNFSALLQVFRDADGDDARQAALLHCGRVALQFSLTLLGIVMLLAIIAVLAPWAQEWNESQQIIYSVATSVVACGWWYLRHPRKPHTQEAQLTMGSHAYGTLERWLHWLALEPAAVRHVAFDLECQYALPTSGISPRNKPSDGAVYVCGLARSGTTMLLHMLDQIDIFRSPTYRDMPFVLAPNLWKQITRHSPRQTVAAERAHCDGIHVDFDSPEGFEEVFWRTFGTLSTEGCCLCADEPSAEALARFADYRALVANPRTEPAPTDGRLRRYLSKNNNNLLRLRSLCDDPTATVLLVYRNPLATARSSHHQHERFCATQAKERFTRTYMGWLAHHEFGLDHLPFCFAVPEMEKTSYTPDNPNYWLAYWNAVYQHVLARHDLRFHLINHDALCAEPVKTLDAIFATLGVQADIASLAQRINPPKADNADGFCTELLQRAEATYRVLLDSPKNIAAEPTR